MRQGEGEVQNEKYQTHVGGGLLPGLPDDFNYFKARGLVPVETTYSHVLPRRDGPPEAQGSLETSHGMGWDTGRFVMIGPRTAGVRPDGGSLIPLIRRIQE